MARSQTGLLIIRAWTEPGSSKPLRAQVRLGAGAASRFVSQTTLADVSEITVAVQAWLHELVGDSDRVEQPPLLET